MVPRRMQARRLGYRAMTVALAALALLVLADVRWAVFGVELGGGDGRSGRWWLVRGRVPASDPKALASPLAVEVSRPDGFDGPVEIAVSWPWIEIWDENGLYPTPESEVGEEHWVVYEFEPPDGDTFRFFYDARLEPARQESQRGAVRLRSGDQVEAEIELTTTVRP